jgi:hypothetical protein
MADHPDDWESVKKADHDDWQPVKQAEPSGWVDFFRSMPRAAVKGAAEFGHLLQQGQQQNVGLSPGEVSIPTPEETTQAVEKNITGPMHEPESIPGRYGAAVAGAVANPLSYIGPGGVVAKGISAAGSGAGGEAAGQLTQGSPWEGAARLVGALAGGAAAPRAVTPFPMSPERQAIVDALAREGVTGMSAGTSTGHTGLKYAEDVLSTYPFGGGGLERSQREALGQYTRAALRRVGENADRATPEVVDRAFNRIGGDFDRLTANNTMQLDQPVQNDMLNSVINYHDNTAPLLRSPLPENVMNDVASWAGSQGGQLTGRQYQNLRSRLGAASRGAADPQLSHALSDMTESLDNAMERSIAATNPADSGAFGEARRQYRNMLTIERAATAGGERAAEGFITPAQLRTAVKAMEGTRAYARGQGDFSELAHSGNAGLLPLPNSGTAQRNAIVQAIEHFGLAGLFGGGAEYSGGIPSALGVGAAGIAGPAATGRALMSPPAQAYMRNQILPDQVSLYGNAIRALTSDNQQSKPDVPGVRPGRRADGTPGWFVEDPSRPGKHMEVRTGP